MKYHLLLFSSNTLTANIFVESIEIDLSIMILLKHTVIQKRDIYVLWQVITRQTDGLTLVMKKAALLEISR